jgi:hypothetical protein
MDAYDGQFHLSSVVPFGVENFAEGLRRNFKMDAYDGGFFVIGRPLRY